MLFSVEHSSRAREASGCCFLLSKTSYICEIQKTPSKIIINMRSWAVKSIEAVPTAAPGTTATKTPHQIYPNATLSCRIMRQQQQNATLSCRTCFYQGKRTEESGNVKITIFFTFETDIFHHKKRKTGYFSL